MSSKETFAKGVGYRMEGNDFFKAEEYTQALKSYYFAILHLKTVGGVKEQDEFKPAYEEQLVKIYNNMSTVYSKQNKWERVIQYSTKARHSKKKALELDGGNAKSLFRLGQAYIRAGIPEKAYFYLRDAADKNPNDPLVKHEMALLDKLKEKHDKTKDTLYRDMVRKIIH
ncbi:hypothetical protein BDF14DRAFT_1879650 [Spinellus fusiger]|nr:hypothetical protein BDF14DRAFT_1879650 [Spinellus fusiger]